MLFFAMKKIEKLYSAYKQTSGVSTDSRKIIKGCLFFALKGPNLMEINLLNLH